MNKQVLVIISLYIGTQLKLVKFVLTFGSQTQDWRDIFYRYYMIALFYIVITHLFLILILLSFSGLQKISKAMNHRALYIMYFALGP